METIGAIIVNSPEADAMKEMCNRIDAAIVVETTYKVVKEEA